MTDIEVAKYILTVSNVLITGAPMGADFNKTHATNPLWTGHARFHVVWQVLTYFWLGNLNMYLMWFSSVPVIPALSIACAILFCIMGGFYSTAGSVKLFGGKFYDENGYLPFARPVIFGRVVELDVNVVAFSIFTAILSVAAFMIYRAS